MAERMWPTREDLAWAAGLFEGEGCFTGARGGRSAPCANMRMTDFPIVERFREVMGVGGLCLPTVGERCKPILLWSTSTFEQTQHVVVSLWPWLGARRRGRAAELFKEYQANGSPLYRTLAFRLFNKRFIDLTDSEVLEYARVRQMAKRHAAGARSLVPEETLAFRLFGKRYKDLDAEGRIAYAREQGRLRRERLREVS